MPLAPIWARHPPPPPGSARDCPPRCQEGCSGRCFVRHPEGSVRGRVHRCIVHRPERNSDRSLGRSLPDRGTGCLPIHPPVNLTGCLTRSGGGNSSRSLRDRQARCLPHCDRGHLSSRARGEYPQTTQMTQMVQRRIGHPQIAQTTQMVWSRTDHRRLGR